MFHSLVNCCSSTTPFFPDGRWQEQGNAGHKKPPACLWIVMTMPLEKSKHVLLGNFVENNRNGVSSPQSYVLLEIKRTTRFWIFRENNRFAVFSPQFYGILEIKMLSNFWDFLGNNCFGVFSTPPHPHLEIKKSIDFEFFVKN